MFTELVAAYLELPAQHLAEESQE